MDHLRDVRALDRRIKQLDAQLREAVAATGTALLAIFGAGRPLFRPEPAPEWRQNVDPPARGLGRLRARARGSGRTLRTEPAGGRGPRPVRRDVMARTPPGPSPDEIDLTDMAAPMVPMGANPDDAILRQIVESVAYGYESPDIRAASSPRLELDRLRTAAQELLRRADVASLAAQAARHEEAHA